MSTSKRAQWRVVYLMPDPVMNGRVPIALNALLSDGSTHLVALPYQVCCVGGENNAALVRSVLHMLETHLEFDVLPVAAGPYIYLGPALACPSEDPVAWVEAFAKQTKGAVVDFHTDAADDAASLNTRRETFRDSLYQCFADSRTGEMPSVELSDDDTPPCESESTGECNLSNEGARWFCKTHGVWFRDAAGVETCPVQEAEWRAYEQPSYEEFWGKE